MEEYFARTEMLIGADAVEKLKKASVILFGVGGVGSFAAEALARSGVGKITVVDSDFVSPSNLNRQLIATRDTVGTRKVDAVEKRINAINPDCVVQKRDCFFSEDNLCEFDFSQYDFIIDAIDTVSSKIELIKEAKKSNTRIISCMGTGNKLDPTKLCVCDIYATAGCPLARVVRKQCRDNGIEHLSVVFSTEEPKKPLQSINENGRNLPSSMIFVPACAGMTAAAFVVSELIK